jgi:hypothetical protein
MPGNLSQAAMSLWAATPTSSIEPELRVGGAVGSVSARKIEISIFASCCAAQEKESMTLLKWRKTG